MIQITLFDVLLGVLRRKRPLAILIGVSTAAALLISFLIPATYTSTTKLMPPQQNQSIASSLLGQLGPLAGLAGKELGARNPSELYVDILKSQTVQDALIQRFNLMSVYRTKLQVDARKKLTSRSEFIADKEGIISISVSDRDPKRAADLANGYVDELYQLNKTLAVSEAGQRRLFFQEQLNGEKTELSNAEVALKQTEEKSGLIQLDSQARATIEQNSRLEAELAAAEVQLRSMTSFATSENPDYVGTQEQIKALREELNENRKKGGGPGTPELGTGTIPEVGLEYIRKVRDVKYHEALYELLMRQYEAAKIDEAKSASIIQILDKGLVPERRSAPSRRLYAAIGFLLGALASIVWALSAEIGIMASGNAELAAKLKEMRDQLKWSRPPKRQGHLTSR